MEGAREGYGCEIGEGLLFFLWLFCTSEARVRKRKYGQWERASDQITSVM